mmetsp:Transcript_28772/g.66991  ORF Transcript_28772/g.66991 Transcript_28772/m.66991 type:complete len:249 (-) Transcript_28772:689-1435(-)
MFFFFISLIDPKNVNLASEETNVSRASDILLWDAIRTAYTNPIKQTPTLRSSSEHSRICERIPSSGPHVTSNMGRTTSDGATESKYVEFPRCARTIFSGLRRINVSVAFISSSFSFLNVSLFRCSAVAPNNVPPSKKTVGSKTCCFCASRSRAASSSFRLNGFTLMRSKIPVRNSAGRSELSAPMPRFMFLNASGVIFFSGLMLGLCKSVFSMITENAKMNAVSADGKISGFCVVNFSANFSIMRSIF